MSAATNAGKSLLLVLLSVTSACSITPPQHHQEALQHSALTRWNGCIERNQEIPDTFAMDLHRVIRARCEGYQRDVLATFPLHLENQVQSILSKRSNKMTAEYFIQSGKKATWNILESTHLDTLKLRSPSALAEDL